MSDETAAEIVFQSVKTVAFLRTPAAPKTEGRLPFDREARHGGRPGRRDGGSLGHSLAMWGGDAAPRLLTSEKTLGFIGSFALSAPWHVDCCLQVNQEISGVVRTVSKPVEMKGFLRMVSEVARGRTGA